MADATAKKTKGSHGGTAASMLEASASAPDLSSSLPPSKVKKRKPGTAWDGRVSGMSLQEYRERKWSMDACYGKVMRGGPSYTCRPSPPLRSRSAYDVLLPIDPARSYNKTAIHQVASYSMASQSLGEAKERSQGPAQYRIPSTLDGFSHPTMARDGGRRFGTEVLLVNDEAQPAPGDYDTSGYEKTGRYKKNPNFSIQGREAWKDPTAAPGPGVGEYKYEGVTRTGKTLPTKYSMQGKTEPIEPPRGNRRYIPPGPPDYKTLGAGARNDYVSKERAPQYTQSRDHRGLLD